MSYKVLSGPTDIVMPALFEKVAFYLFFGRVRKLRKAVPSGGWIDASPCCYPLRHQPPCVQ